MKFQIDDNIFERYPSLHMGVVVAKGIDNTGEEPVLVALLEEQCAHMRSQYDGATLKDLPNMSAWREVYQSFGAKPKKYTCSVENLYRMILGGMQLTHINKVVDLYNYVSLKYMVPVGGDDSDHVEGGIRLQFAKGTEPFIRLNGGEVDYPKEGEVIYADEKEVLCRRWNWRECDKSKMTKETKNVVLVVEGIAPLTKENVQQIVEELAQLVQQYCGGTVESYVLCEGDGEIEV